MSASDEAFLPPAWNRDIHNLWLTGNTQQAISETVVWLESLSKSDISYEQLQLAYYYYFTNDFAHACKTLEQIVEKQGRNYQALVNLAVCHSRLLNYEQAIKFALQANEVREDYLPYDVMSNAYNQLGQKELASRAGTNALRIKDEMVSKSQEANDSLKQWQLPEVAPETFSQMAGKRKVISFSLWGSDPRYLRGAIQNMLYAPRIFPDWQIRFYLDNSVPKSIQQLLQSLGAHLIVMADGASIREKLTWRFKVSEDPFVGRFLVRDVDSVFSEREKNAVNEWLMSDKWFHVMRDWWSHTDLILAGMWGGVAGILPSLTQLLAEYKSKAVETPNIDQWFLRDSVWPYIRQSCLTHDRCFTFNSRPMPDGPGTDAEHVGQNEYAVNEAAQAQLLVNWINSVPQYPWHEVAPALGFIKK